MKNINFGANMQRVNINWAITRTVIVFCFSLIVLPKMAMAAPGATANDPFFNTTNQVGDCGNSYGFGSCTANDFRITSIVLSNLVDSCISDTDYFQADVTVQFSKAQPIRYDVMAYFYRGEEDGDPFNLTDTAADDGLWCTRIGLNNNIEIIDAGVPSGLFTGDIDDEDNDSVTGNDPDSFCFDAPNGAADGTIEQTELSMVLPCRDGDGNGIVDIATCTGWANNAQGTCSGPEYDGVTEPQNGTGSKCNCGLFDTVPSIGLPDIAITKNCAGDGTGGTDAPDGSGNYAPGDVVLCTIEITNGPTAGTLIGATNATEEGFFYVDDYDDSNGTISNISVVNDSGSTAESSSDTGTQLNIYPDDILAGGTVTIEYLYTIDASASFGQASEDIPNEVCAYYYDSTNMSATLNDEFCANDTITTTPVTLAEFSALKEGNKVRIVWATATETSNLGFNLYGQFGSSRIKLNDEIIPSKAINSLEVLDYEYEIARNDVAGVSRFYLEDIDLTGQSSMAGPFEYVKKKESKDIRAPKTDWASIGYKNRGQYTKANTPVAKGRGNGKGKGPKPGGEDVPAQSVSIRVDSSGLVQLPSTELAQYGFDHKTLKDGQFSLVDARGNPIASHYSVSGNSGNLEFIATVERTFYAQSDSYVLKKASQADTALTMLSASDVAPATGANLDYYFAKSSVATDSLYHLGSTVDSDPWMMTRVFAFGTTPSQTTITVPMDNVAQNTGVAAKVTAEALGGFDPDGRQDRIFGLAVGSTALDSQPGSGLRVNRLKGSVSLLPNQSSIDVTVSNLQTNDFGIDISYINKVEVEYPRTFDLQDGALTFSSDNSEITLTNIQSSAVHVYAASNSGMVYLGQTPVVAGEARFAGIEGATQYHAFVDEAETGYSLTPFTPLDVTALVGQSVVIAHPQFMGEALQDYVTWRDANLGVQSAIVSTDDVYCAYSGCARSALAIKQFITDLDKNNNLSSAMLVGGDVYDYHDNLGVGAVAFVPTLYARTGDLIGFAPVDALYGDVDNDGLPDVAVGRLPVRTSAELESLLLKSQQYGEQKGRTTAVLTADEQTSSSAYDFAGSSDSVASILAAQGWLLNKQYLDDYLAQDPSGANRNAFVEQARQGVLSGLDAGPRLAIYTGHSSAVSWSFANLFNYAATKQLTNTGSPSLYLQWGCYNTYYSHPTTESLSHGLLLSGTQGAAVVIGASSLTNAVTEEQFAGLIQAQLISVDTTVGAAMVNAKRELADENGVVDLDILWSVTLLGDPELRL